MRRFRYELAGIDGEGKAFTVSGEIEETRALGFAGAPGAALSDAFQKLTDGNAEYGKPGEGGCRGPYTFERIVLETVKG